MSATGRVLLVDASIYVFRAWHSMPDTFEDAEGHPANAVHGFLRFLLDLLERSRPSHIAVAFDEALDSGFRNTLYPPYKANRDPAPPSLLRQFGQCRTACEVLGLATLSHPTFEADDLIGSLLQSLRRDGMRGVIVSPDKDLAQLLDEGDTQWDLARDQRWDMHGVKERYGVHPHQIPDFLGLAGDAVDNIPGVPGIGAKTAAALLEHFGSLDALLQRVDEVPFLRLRGAAAQAARLREHADMARLSRTLATIRRDILPDARADDVRILPRPRAELDDFAEQLRLGPMTRRRLQAVADANRPAV